MSGNVQRPGGEHVIGNPTGMPHNKNVEPWDCLSCNPSGWPKERWINNEQRRQSYNTETQRSRTSPVPPVDDEQPDTERLVALYAKTIDGLRAEVFRAVQVIPNEFLASDPWENGVQRMADEISRLRAADAHPPVRVQPDTDEPQEHWRCGRCGASPVAHAQGGTAEECIYSPILCDAGPARSELVALAKAQSEAARLRAVLVALVDAIGGDMDEILAAVDRARAALAAPTTKRRPTDDDAT